MNQKSELRKKFFPQRLQLAVQEHRVKSQAICKCLIKFLEHRSSISQLFLFAAFKNEPDILVNFDQFTQTIGLPITGIDGQIKAFYQIGSTDELQAGYQDILEPKWGRVLKPDAQTVVVVPALAIDRSGYRLGYGKGGYDRFLSLFPELIKVGVVFDEFLVEELPKEAHDVRLDFCITNTQIWPFL